MTITPDQTPVTDDDAREMHAWCDSFGPSDENQSPLAKIIRYVRVALPIPPATLADELRSVARKTKVSAPILALADRAEAIEKENRDTDRVLNEAWAERDEARAEVQQLTKERDEARAKLDRASAAFDEVENRNLNLEADLNVTRIEVKKALHSRNVMDAEANRLDSALAIAFEQNGGLRTEVDRLTRESAARLDQINVLMSKVDRMLAMGSTYPADDLPDPADVPKGEPWLVSVDDEPPTPAFRSHGVTWVAFRGPREPIVISARVTLISRLVPDVRRVIDRPEDLDKLPVGSVVLEGGREAWRRGEDMWWHGTGGTSFAPTSLHVQESLPVTVIHEPEVTA